MKIIVLFFIVPVAPVRLEPADEEALPHKTSCLLTGLQHQEGCSTSAS